jgi:hypothetical protein
MTKTGNQISDEFLLSNSLLGSLPICKKKLNSVARFYDVVLIRSSID